MIAVEAELYVEEDQDAINDAQGRLKGVSRSVDKQVVRDRNCAVTSVCRLC